MILHAANLEHRIPPGSLAGLELSLKAGINQIEVDVTPMKDGDFALLHDPKLKNVSSVADWALRVLHKIAPDLLLGFDPLLYLDLVHKEPREEGIPPIRVGAFGYLDDHPLAVQRWGKLSEYFEVRAETLLLQVPARITWFINAQLLDEASRLYNHQSPA
ncbi:MAG: hypothetical protein CVU41_11620 [Chloroflexi bacterium HGW-Chloroflexi-3]|nr:MAG: hypothetical protein CVU41_11620 [Chloroflexi bacterium HGW-Chloroflexi-3]